MEQKKLNAVNDKIIKLQEEQIKKLKGINDKIINLQEENIKRLKGVVEILELRNRFLENKIARVLNKVNIEL
tara:strand:+ start:255 stop:470 length:216 start_codon:yes stop_codon:yes gene_type:complete